MADLGNPFFLPPYTTLSSPSPSTSSSHLYSNCVNWEESIDSLMETRSQERIKRLSCDWRHRLRLPVVKRSSFSPRKNGSGIKVVRRLGVQKLSSVILERSRKSKSVQKCVNQWVKKKVESKVPETECSSPFLEKDPNSVECRICHKSVEQDKVLCSVSSCKQAYHLTCVKKTPGLCRSRKFKCPQHECFLCKQRGVWQCTECIIAAHLRCSPWPDRVRNTGQPGKVVCWRHSTDSQLENKTPVPASGTEGIFSRLPVLAEKRFSMSDRSSKEPNPYQHIRRNVYLIKKKRNEMSGCPGCTDCDASGCVEDCVCRVQSISCSKDCKCSETCTNRPFRRDKKIKLYKSELCGWGVEAAEPIKEGDFVIEYIGEVINDAECEQRFWLLRAKQVKEFYLCEIRKDFTIDATYKGNLSRFLNHSCDPNCQMEKWEVDGETRVGIFAMKSIEVGEPLTYDYRFVCFGADVICRCGSANCHGFLGSRGKPKEKLNWRMKRRRSTYKEMEPELAKKRKHK